MPPAVGIDELAATDCVLVALATIGGRWLNRRGSGCWLIHHAVRGPNAWGRMRERGLAGVRVQAPFRSGCELNRTKR